ncbi:MAG TPA: flavodoxin family protein [Synergistaceae bacterium]|nr:flavodoxin family protein [Synergistaceae bacterium]HPJ24837.1 flavodoxin family protein [Synergistaceae bacterium]HPQ36472.1 flavodoxin family protein [Synergistaceae bacterium]
MRIFLVNGDPREECETFRENFEALHGFLALRGHSVKSLHLKDKNIAACVGCFSCWLQNPGICIFKDDHVSFLQSLLWAEVTIFISPLIMGFPSALLKNAIDRFIPNALPYIELDEEGECRHPMRYDKNPLMALLYEPEEDTDEEDLQIITTAFERFARNAHTRLLFTLPLGKENFEEVHHALEHL